jgi:molecular chaperone Hsp33|nr:Hsp33 family molecular chaperone HslO [Tuberibacillus calidus]
MALTDYLIKALAMDGHVRAMAVRTTEMVSEVQKRHDVWPTASAALGRTMTAATMLACQLKGDDKLTVTVEGGGPIGAIIVDANAKGETRGYVTNPHVHFELNAKGKLDVSRAVGTTGQLSVVKDLGLKDNFVGRVPIVSGEIGDDFTYYLARSEQIPSAVGVGVLVNPDYSIKASGGFLLQLLPGAPSELIDMLEKRLKEIPMVSQMIDRGDTPEDMLVEIFGENVKIIDRMPVQFKCACSRERIENSLVGLGKEELKAMIEEDHGAEVTCHFCNEIYRFTEEDLKAIYDNMDD